MLLLLSSTYRINMKTKYLHVRMLLVAILMMLPMLATAAEGDSLYVYFNGYRLDVFPSSYIKSQMEANGQLRVTVINDTTFCYDLDRIDSVCYHRPQNMPSFSSFKFNNKYNDQVFTDAEADIAGDSLITARVGAIGKWLTPSFQLSEETDRVYIDGQRQQSKVNRHKFDKDVIYTVGRHGWREFKKTLAKEALWSDSVGRYTTTEVMLSADQFSSNLPGKDGEGFAQMLDGNTSTFFHSTWDVSSDLKPIIYVTEPYLDIALNESLRRVSFSYVTRTSGSYWPLKLTLFASNDGNEWTQIREFTEADNLPTYAGATYRSPVIDLGQDYSHLRILLQASPYRLYLVFAEFNLWRIDENPDYHGPELLEPAEYRYVMQPYGREYRMHVDWLTDLETSSVPRIDINTNGQLQEGFHRLTAVVEAGVPVKMMVARGVAPEAVTVYDCGILRNATHVMQVTESKNPSVVASIVKLHSILRNNHRVLSKDTKRKVLSNQQVHDAYMADQKGYEDAAVVGAKYSKQFGVFTKSWAGAIYYYLTADCRYPRKAVIDFYDSLFTMDTGKIQQADQLRRTMTDLIAKKYKVSDEARWTFFARAWNAYAAGTPVKRLKMLADGEEVPTVSAKK